MINKSTRQSPRLYENDFMEVLSKCPFWLPPVVFLPVITYLLYSGLSSSPKEGLLISIFIAGCGIAFWTALEYVIHRFIFHYKPKTKAGKRFIYVVHGIHHDYPNDFYRLVFPVSVTIPLTALFYFMFSLIPWSHESYLSIFFGFFLLSYLCYDMLHFALHAFSGKKGFFAYIKNHHLTHHYKTPEARFGVTSALWDTILSTKGKPRT